MYETIYIVEPADPFTVEPYQFNATHRRDLADAWVKSHNESEVLKDRGPWRVVAYTMTSLVDVPADAWEDTDSGRCHDLGPVGAKARRI